MLRCADGTYYVGHTDDLEARVAAHAAGVLPGYTQRRRPVELVWSQETASREEALGAEQRIKGWGRAKKEALVRGDWDEIRALAKSREESAGVSSKQVTGLRQAQPERGAKWPNDGLPSPNGVSRPTALPSDRLQPAGASSVRPEPVEGPAPTRRPTSPLHPGRPLPPFALSLSKGPHRTRRATASLHPGRPPPPFALSLSKGRQPPRETLS